MTEKKSLVEEAILQMKNLEEAVAENAKGILASTMRQEIKDLVKESLKEQDDEEIEDDDVDMGDSEMDDSEMDMEDDEMDDEDMDMSEPDMEVNTIDLTKEPTSTVLKVFKLMKDDDEIVVTKDGSNINLIDNETNKEYMIVTEGMEDYSDEDLFEMDDDPKEMFEMDDMMSMDEMDDMMSMDEMDDMMSMDEMDDMMSMDDSDEELFEMDDQDIESQFEDVFGEETIYEIEMDSEEEDLDSDDEVSDYFLDNEEEYMMEAKKSSKPKGMGFGSAQSYKMSKTPNMDGGFKVVKRNADKTMGTGSAKKANIYKKDSPSFDGDFDSKPTKSKESKGSMNFKPKTGEFKEASRTLGNGKYWGREGLPKPRTAPRHIRKESIETEEVNLLREKNEEYRKALNVFRTKLNEVAVFNSNLAYATRLFTEHTTSKNEKLNILKRFDGVETLKESKNLYKVIKDELSTSKPQQVTESFERTITRTPSTGSAINLIESKTYENPQFLRMKDLMTKLK
jgi:hypothetical protein